MRAAGKSPIRADEVHTLAGLMLAGGVGRLISRAVNGRPHWFQYVLAAGICFPAAFFGLADALQKAALGPAVSD